MYDLIDESGKDLQKLGYKVKDLGRWGFSIASLVVDNEKSRGEKDIEIGKYYILNCPNFFDYGIDCYDFIINYFLKILKESVKTNRNQKVKVLIVGLGNPDIQADRLGKEVFDNIKISPLENENRVFKFCPNIFFLTGISTAELIKLIANRLEVDYCILIDSLTTNNIERIGCSFQFTTNGITPGSGVNRFGQKIDKDYLGVDCYCIGVPFMIFSSSFKNGKSEKILTLKDIDDYVSACGFLIAKSLNIFLNLKNNERVWYFCDLTTKSTKRIENELLSFNSIFFNCNFLFSN